MTAPIGVRYTSGHVTIVGDRYGEDDGRGRVMLLHGGGQTRHSWSAVATRLAELGWAATALDARGHGDSTWDPGRDYSIDVMVDDLAACIADGERPVLIGASLGGLVSIMAVGEGRVSARALVLVDIVPDVESAGAVRIRQFMADHLAGFDSLDEVRATLAAYNPRPNKRSTRAGLKKVVRQRPDGRWYWHWDPAFALGREPDQPYVERDSLVEAAKRIDVPVLLVRGARSDIVSRGGVEEFLTLVPGAQFVEVADTSHMVAGDDNAAFSSPVIAFLDSLPT